MLAYWLLIAVWIVGAVQFSRNGSALTAKPLFMMALLFTAAIIGWRYHVGGDWRSYDDMFGRFYFLEFKDVLGASNSRSSSGDPGYSALNWIVSRVGLGIVTVNLVCGLIVTWGLARFAMRQPNPWLTIVVAVPYFVIVVAMGYTRQAVAIGIIMAGLAELRDRSLSRLIVYIFFAALFHKTAVIILPILAMAVLRRNLLAGFASAIVFVAFYYLFLDASADTLTTNYVKGNYDSQGAAIRVAMDVIAAILLFVFRNRMGFNELERATWMSFAAFAAACVPALILASASSGVDRLALFLIPLQLVTLGRLPYALSDRPTPNLAVFGAVIAYCFAIQFTWLNYANNAMYWVPYHFAPVSAGEDR